MSATAIVQRGSTLTEETTKLPELQPNQLLVKVAYAAFNPTDRQAFDGQVFDEGAVLGCDFAGTVEKVGSQASNFSVGDRISALVWGGEIPPLGAYSTKCIADDKIAFKIPTGLGDADASTIPLAVNTAWLAMFAKNCLNLSREKSGKQSLLVWGGASTVGAFTIQLAKLFNILVITTCSPRNFSVVKSHGATHVFDYNDPEVISKIQKAAPDVEHIFDTIGNETSSAFAASALGGRKGNLCTVRPGKVNTNDVPKSVNVTDVFVFMAFLKEHVYKKTVHWDADQHSHDLSHELYRQLPAWISSGDIKPQPVKDLGKLSVKSVEQAMALNRDGKVSNEKLCFQVG